MRQRRWSGLATLIVMVLVFGSAAACGDSSSDAATCEGKSGEEPQTEELGSADDPDGAGKKIGLVFDVGGVGDKGFNDSANLAITTAAENMGVESQQLEPNADGSNRGELMRSLAEDGYEMIIGVGFAFAEDMDTIAADFPDIKFAIVDGVVEQPNVTSLIFAEEQGSFLVGAAAALKTKSRQDRLHRRRRDRADPEVRGRLRGRGQEGRPDVEVDVKYLTPDGDFTGFDDPAKGKTIADGMYEDGVRRRLRRRRQVRRSACSRRRSRPTGWPSASTPTSTSRSTAAQQKCMLTSMLKRVDVAVYDAIKPVRRRFARGRRGRRDLKAGRHRLRDRRRPGRRRRSRSTTQAADHRRRDQGAHRRPER